MADAPPSHVIVLGIDTPIGLTIIRELGARGIAVHGIARAASSIGLYSRFLTKGYVHPRRDASLVALINSIASEHAAPPVMTVSEGDIVFLNRHRSALAGVELLIPGLNQIECVIDKSRVYAAAETAGLAVPRSFSVDSLAELDRTSHEITFPVVLKWANPNVVIQALTERGLPLNKAEYCYDRGELARALARYSAIGEFPLIQEYCAGYGLGQMVYMHNGKPILRFQHRRVNEWPPEGGFSTLCESLDVDTHAALFEQSIELLRAVEWEGPAMVEYRHDPATGKSVLMEINGRFWGSQPLAWHSGAHFAWTLYSVAGKRTLPEATRAAVGVKCKFTLPDIKRLYRILFRPELIQDRHLRFSRLGELLAFLGYYFDPRHRYFVFSWDDPMPFFADMFHALKSRLLKLP